MRVSIILIGLGLMLGLPTNVQAVEPDIKCESDKIKTAGKYTGCLMGTYSKAVKKGEVPDFTKCDSKYSAKWKKVESKAGGACPTEGDEAAIQARMTGDANDIVTLLGGGTLESCGDGVKNGTEDCDDPDLGGATCAVVHLVGEGIDALIVGIRGIGEGAVYVQHQGTVILSHHWCGVHRQRITVEVAVVA